MEQVLFIIGNPLWQSFAAIATTVSFLLPLAPFIKKRSKRSNQYITIVIIKPPGRTLIPQNQQNISPPKTSYLTNTALILFALYGILFSTTFLFFIPHEIDLTLFLISVLLLPASILLLLLRSFSIIRNK